MKQRLADYVADFLVDHGITDCFMVTGGGAMHLNDALGHKEGMTVFTIIMSRAVPLRQRRIPAFITGWRHSV